MFRTPYKPYFPKILRNHRDHYIVLKSFKVSQLSKLSQPSKPFFLVISFSFFLFGKNKRCYFWGEKKRRGSFFRAETRSMPVFLSWTTGMLISIAFCIKAIVPFTDCTRSKPFKIPAKSIAEKQSPAPGKTTGA